MLKILCVNIQKENIHIDYKINVASSSPIYICMYMYICTHTCMYYKYVYMYYNVYIYMHMYFSVYRELLFPSIFYLDTFYSSYFILNTNIYFFVNVGPITFKCCMYWPWFLFVFEIEDSPFLLFNPPSNS